MRLSGSGAVLSLFPFFLGWFSLVAASPDPPSWRRDATPDPPSWRRDAIPDPPSWRREATPDPPSWRRDPIPDPPSWRRDAIPDPPSWRRDAIPDPPSWRRGATPDPPSWRRDAAPDPPSWRRDAIPDPPSWRRDATPDPPSWRRDATPDPPSWRRSMPTHGKDCLKPQVRREWRVLSDRERTEWISAVKVGLSIGETPTPVLEIPRRSDISLGDQCLAKVPHKEYVVPYPNHVNYAVDVPLDKSSSMFDGASSCFSRHSRLTQVQFRFYFCSYGSRSSGMFLPRPTFRIGDWHSPLPLFRFRFDFPDSFHGELLSLAPFVHSQVRTCSTGRMRIQRDPTVLGLDQRFVPPLGNSDLPKGAHSPDSRRPRLLHFPLL